MDSTLSKAILSAMFLLLGWNVYTTHDLAVSVAIIEERTANYNIGLLEERVSEISAKLEKHPVDVATQRLNRLEQWSERLSTRLADVESTIRNGK